MQIQRSIGLVAIIVGLMMGFSDAVPVAAQDSSANNFPQTCKPSQLSHELQHIATTMHENGDDFVIIPNSPPVEDPPAQAEGLISSLYVLGCADGWGALVTYQVTYGPTSSSFQTSSNLTAVPRSGFCSSASCTVLHGINGYPGEFVVTHTAFGAYIWQHNGVCTQP